jgi:signal transduction histidine kinase
MLRSDSQDTIYYRVSGGDGHFIAGDVGLPVPHQRIRNPAAGSGLGLSIVREVAAFHGAEITLDTGADGHGTVIRMTFRESLDR